VTRRLYSVVTALAVPIAFALVLLRGLRDRGYWEGLGERFGFGARLPTAGGVWVHAVSLGEVTAAAPFVRALQRHRPGAPLLLTTATPTGRARARSLFADAVEVRYLPYDLTGALRRFFARTRPGLGVIMETELWPNLYRECARRGLPMLLGSARISERSLARYARFGRLFRGVFTANLVIGAQTAADAARFRALGAAPSRVHVTGNVKFDIDIDPATRATSQRLRALLAGADRPVWIAGSTHPGEEESVLDAHAAVTARHPDALLILVPRHPQRFDAVAALLARRGVAHVRRSTLAGASPGTAAGAAAHAAVLLVDTTGELLMFYGCADAAFVGGSLVPIGGHNLLEPAALGVPVLTGPSDFNAREVAALLLGEGAAHRVADAQELGATLLTWLADPALRREMGARGRRVVDENRGSVARLLALIEPMEAR